MDVIFDGDSIMGDFSEFRFGFLTVAFGFSPLTLFCGLNLNMECVQRAPNSNTKQYLSKIVKQLISAGADVEARKEDSQDTALQSIAKQVWPTTNASPPGRNQGFGSSR